VDVVVGIYSRCDWEDRSTPERDRFVEFLERVVVKRTIARHPEVFRDASPIARAHRNAPPFLVIHGSKDNIIPVEQARSFVERLRAISHSMVGHLELPGAGHGFDLRDGGRRRGGTRDVTVPQPRLPQQDPDRGERGYLRHRR
jgi:dipeptidyl aminopeptidase/acylaminoacyl peptidase